MDKISLSQLCNIIGETLENGLSNSYMIVAEISSLSEKGGHAYFELVEKGEGNNTFKAKVRATCWANRWNMLKAYFLQQTEQSLRVGMQILTEVLVDFHPVYGLSLNIQFIDPNFTLGDLAQQRKVTIQRLTEEGVFDLNKQLLVPTLPQRIAVISSADAAGYGDFCRQLEDNIYDFAFRVELYSAIMQGDRAPKAIIEALDRVIESGKQYDVVLILRGGGATTDLACFDNYDLAFYCANYPLPIVAGIGHTRDISVVDMIAHASVKTPTAAAEWLIERMAYQQGLVDDYQRRLQNTLDRRLLLARHRFDKLHLLLGTRLNRYLQQQRDKLTFAEKTLALRSPEHIYRMGYSLTKSKGKVIRSATGLTAGDTIETYLADGTITSQVL